MVAFEQSQIISPTLTRRVACYLCTCKSDFLFSSRSIIAIQHKMFTWFEEEASNMLSHFKPIVDELKENGCVDSGTKIAFLNLLKDLDAGDEYKLEHLAETCERRGKNMFYAKLVMLEFDLKLCSAREFMRLLMTIDQGAFNFIQITNLSRIVLRDEKRLTVRNLMGQIEATIESEHERNLNGSEFFLRRLAELVNSRLTKSSVADLTSMINLKMILQPAPNTSLSDILALKNASTAATVATATVPSVVSVKNPLDKVVDCKALFEKMNIKISEPKKVLTRPTDLGLHLCSSSPSTKPLKSKSKSKSRSKSSKSSSKQLISTSQSFSINAEDESILNMTASSSSRGSGDASTTPLTSSPISSASAAEKFGLNLKSGGEKKKSRKKRSRSSKKEKKQSSSSNSSDSEHNNNVVEKKKSAKANKDDTKKANQLANLEKAAINI